MEDLSLHMLDVAENALAAGAERIEVRIAELPQEDALRIEIADDGRGMDEMAASRAMDPFYTTKPGKRVGLGLPLLAQAAREAGGGIEVQSQPGNGTVVRATFRLSHPDLKPLGDPRGTLAMLACAHPGVQFTLEHRRNGALVHRWDSGKIRPEGRTTNSIRPEGRTTNPVGK
ncbi:MAG: ATP-binding protein [Planctomycetes bacterium]|nr:ATP-binding protein [Planctomycetota bacterium]